jgi:hypothetical protein
MAENTEKYIGAQFDQSETAEEARPTEEALS